MVTSWCQYDDAEMVAALERSEERESPHGGGYGVTTETGLEGPEALARNGDRWMRDWERRFMR